MTRSRSLRRLAVGLLTDVPPSHSFSMHIRYLSDNDFVDGDADGTSRPSTPGTRGQIAVNIDTIAHQVS